MEQSLQYYFEGAGKIRMTSKNPSIPLLNRLRESDDSVDYKGIILKILTLINSGELKPEENLPGERIIAEALGVGRNSIRMALKFLEFVGIIEISVGKGTFISKEPEKLALIHMIDLLRVLEHVDYKDLFEVRKAIESEMAALAASNADEEDLLKMLSALEKMKRDIGSDDKGVKGADAFHLAICQASKNIILIKIGLMLHGLMHQSRTITLQIPGRTLKSLEEHKKIFESIRKGDSSSAAALMRQHLSSLAHDRALE